MKSSKIELLALSFPLDFFGSEQAWRSAFISQQLSPWEMLARLIFGSLEYECCLPHEADGDKIMRWGKISKLIYPKQEQI